MHDLPPALHVADSLNAVADPADHEPGMGPEAEIDEPERLASRRSCRRSGVCLLRRHDGLWPVIIPIGMAPKSAYATVEMAH